MSDPESGIQTLYPGTAAYDQLNPQYATSTYGVERQMDPGAIILPSSINDISSFVASMNNAEVSPGERRKAMAIRSGGHQYSGASSTDLQNVVLNLANTFKDEEPQLTFENGTAYVRASCSKSLQDLFDFMTKNGIFCPTGQCATVHAGGHVQTGGYGMFSRSLGLLSDYVKELEIVNTLGQPVTVTKANNPDLFYGFLGGCPGNLGVLTHAKWEVQQDIKHKGSRALWAAFLFDKANYKYLLDLIVKAAEDPDFGGNYEFTVNVRSEGLDLNDLFPGSKSELKNNAPHEFFGKDPFSTELRVPLIIVYAQWVKSGNDVFDSSLFDSIKKTADIRFFWEADGSIPVSKLASWWIFSEPREYPYPYVKRTCVSNSVNASKTGWTDWFSDRVDSIVSVLDNGLWFSSQVQVYGGKYSSFRNNANNGTSFAWRDTTFGGTWDVFYEPGSEDAANTWQSETDEGSFGPSGKFCQQERRLLWGSYGDWDMSEVWLYYYDKPTYDRLRVIRGKADPNGIFTPNPFCIPALIAGN